MENTTEEKAVMTIEKTATEQPEVDNEKAQAAQAAYAEFGQSLQTKVYLIPGGKETGKNLQSFLENDAKFTAHESLGIVKAHEDITKAMSSKKKDLFLGNLCIEAIGYYVSKMEGQGLAEAKAFKDNLFTPINEAMAAINEDKKQLEYLQQKWAAAAQGVELENEENVNE